MFSKAQILTNKLRLLGFFAFFPIFLNHNILAQNTITDSTCKLLMIEAAQFAHTSHLMCKESFVTDNIEKTNTYLDSSLFYLFLANVKIDSTLLVANPKDTLAILYTQRTKKFLERSVNKIEVCKSITSLKNKCRVAEDISLYIPNVTIDAYTASLYFKPVEKVKTSDSTNANKDSLNEKSIEKSITKLDVDQTLFTLLNEDLKIKQENALNELKLLKDSLSKSPSIADVTRLKAQIKTLEAKLKELETKNKLAVNKLNDINQKIDQRNKQNAPVENEKEKNIFTKSKKIGKQEWNKQFKTEDELPEGLVFLVQLGVYKKHILPEKFKGITPIYATEIEIGVRYSAGLFEKLQDVQEAKKYIKNLGFNDAFVIAFHNKHKITLSEAKKIEKGD